MFKYVPLLLLTSAVLAAPQQSPPKDALTYKASTGFVVLVGEYPREHGYGRGAFHMEARLRLDYKVRALPGKYTVEFWLGRTDDRPMAPVRPFHFDTQEVTIPGRAEDGPTEVKGVFDRRCCDRPLPKGRRREEECKPGECPLIWVGRRIAPAVAWDCRLVLKRDGKVVLDTGYASVPLKMVVDI